MGKIYYKQTALTITLDTNLDLTNASSAKIKYRKPNGKIGEWTAVIDSPATTGTISYAVQVGDLDMIGDWRFWSYLTFSDGTIAQGESVVQRVYAEGSDDQ